MPPVATSATSRPAGHVDDEGLENPGDLDEEELAEEAFDSDEFRAFVKARYPHRHQRRQGGSTRSNESDTGDGGGGLGSSGPPPEWDGETPSFQDYAIKARLWLATTKARPRARGPLLLQKLTKTPFETMKYLARDRAWMNSDGNGEELITLMELPENFGDDREADLLSALAKITYHLRRSKEEHFRQFFCRWDVAMRKVAEHSVVLPERYVGFLLINALGLNDADIKSLLNYSRGSIKPSDIREWIRKHETKLQASQVGLEKKGATSTTSRTTSSSAAHHVQMEPNEIEEDEIFAVEEALNDLQVEEDDDFTLEEGDGTILEEHEAAEVLSTILQQKKKTYMQTLKAKKSKELSRGYSHASKFKPGKSFTMTSSGAPFKEGNYRMTIEELKKVTKCAICRKPGHWHKECPDKDKDRNAPKEAHSLEEAIFCGHLEEHQGGHDLSPGQDHLICEASVVPPADVAAGSSSLNGSHTAPPAESAYRVELLGGPPTNGRHEVLSSVHECYLGERGNVSEPMKPEQYPDACATIDTGCQRMVVGRKTLEDLARCLPPDLPVRTKGQEHRFKSVHGISNTQRVAMVPSSLGNRGSYLMPAIFDNPESVTAPFLISLPFLMACKAVIYLDQDSGLRVHFQKQGFTVRCHLGPSGALRIPLGEFSRKQLEALSKEARVKNTKEIEILETVECS